MRILRDPVVTIAAGFPQASAAMLHETCAVPVEISTAVETDDEKKIGAIAGPDLLLR